MARAVARLYRLDGKRYGLSEREQCWPPAPLRCRVDRWTGSWSGRSAHGRRGELVDSGSGCGSTRIHCHV